VTATARRLSAESLDERIGLRTGPADEVAELAATFDAMLDRLQGAFETQRRFVANASHELRTPLAVMRTEIDVTLADPDADPDELRRMGEVVRDAGRRAEHLVAGLLLLARTEGSGLSERVRLDLADAVPGALDGVRDETAARALTVRRVLEPAPVEGDPALLERVVGNLVENAVRHNVDAGWIEITTGVETGAAREGGAAREVVLCVASSGAAVDATTVAVLFEPFRRGTDRTGSGSGLGLSIVRAVVGAHGGLVEAEPVAGGGLRVRVRLPASD